MNKSVFLQLVNKINQNMYKFIEKIDQIRYFILELTIFS